MDTKERAASIAAKNDRMREYIWAHLLIAGNPSKRVNGRVVATQGVAAMQDQMSNIIGAVRKFKDFSPANNPHEERDFGSIEAAGEKIFWKIDYYSDSKCE